MHTRESDKELAFMLSHGKGCYLFSNTGELSLPHKHTHTKFYCVELMRRRRYIAVEGCPAGTLRTVGANFDVTCSACPNGQLSVVNTPAADGCFCGGNGDCRDCLGEVFGNATMEVRRCEPQHM